MYTHVAFIGHCRLAAGSLAEVAAAVTEALASAGNEPMPLVFDAASGAVVDLDPCAVAANVVALPRGRGRPSLGVVPREVTLLPRHWDWLAAQPGGASVALRRLIDTVRKDAATAQRTRRDAVYRCMAAFAGDLPGFEAASRALFADDAAGFVTLLADWPADVRDHLLAMHSG
jgi:hypothetical protein